MSVLPAPRASLRAPNIIEPRELSPPWCKHGCRGTPLHVAVAGYLTAAVLRRATTAHHTDQTVDTSAATGCETGGRYPEHDICENFNSIDVRELQRKTGWRPGLCFMKVWYRNGAPAGEVFIFTQPDAIVLVHRACPPGSTESRIIELQVPIIWTKCHLGGRRPWFECLTIINGEVCGLQSFTGRASSVGNAWG